MDILLVPSLEIIDTYNISRLCTGIMHKGITFNLMNKNYHDSSDYSSFQPESHLSSLHVCAKSLSDCR